MTKPTSRATATALHTYHRPVSEGASMLESWEQVVERVVGHQRWLWERALGRSLNEREEDELEEMHYLIFNRYIAVAGRTLWLGGTELSRTRESSMFNCSYTHVETVYDMVDVLWLLLQGCGVGFRPITGTLNGFRRPHRSLHVLSLNAPIRGWMNRPVMGPAMFRIGRSCSLAPMYKNSGLTAENTIPNPNELPKRFT